MVHVPFGKEKKESLAIFGVWGGPARPHGIPVILSPLLPSILHVGNSLTLLTGVDVAAAAGIASAHVDDMYTYTHLTRFSRSDGRTGIASQSRAPSCPLWKRVAPGGFRVCRKSCLVDKYFPLTHPSLCVFSHSNRRRFEKGKRKRRSF